MYSLQDVLLLLFDLRVKSEDLVAQGFNLGEALSGSFQDDCGDKHIGATHELLVLLHLSVKQTWKDLLSCLDSASGHIDHACGVLGIDLGLHGILTAAMLFLERFAETVLGLTETAPIR